MEPILSAAGMLEADRRTIEDFGTPGRELMENAGHAASERIEERFGAMRGREVLVLAGKGNNGGDGLVVARRLAARGAAVTVVALGTNETSTPDTAANLSELHGIAEVDIRPFTDIDALQELGEPDLIVDALLGVGAAGPLRPPIDSIASWVNERMAPVVSMDVPTGLDSDSGTAARECIRATLTVAMGALKVGLLIGEGPFHAGEVRVATIGMPDAIIRGESTAYRATDGWVTSVLPKRAHDAHKYTSGKALAVVGSREFSGAAILATTAAYRLGAGAVVCCTPASVAHLVDASVPEVMVASQEENDSGSLAITAYDDIVARIGHSDAMLIGCGLGRAPETARLVQALLRRADIPTVIDADGLNAIAGRMRDFAEISKGRFVLTPHLGEFKRMLENDADGDLNRMEAARLYAVRWNAVLVLKGMPTIVGTPDGSLFVGPESQSGLATAGTGDVLAGSIAGLLAQGMTPADAAIAALHIGSAAAQRFAATRGANSMMAGDLLTEIPFVLKERFRR